MLYAFGVGEVAISTSGIDSDGTLTTPSVRSARSVPRWRGRTRHHAGCPRTVRNQLGSGERRRPGR